jgi:LacI family transcriptional regulator, gluconate utilization system Gnt-I transcriptional repressor
MQDSSIPRNSRSSSQRVRMEDVAKRAGVSAQTVSRVIGRPELVSADTRELVEVTIRELNYIPNGPARHLASSRSRTVAAIIPTLATSVYAEEVGSIMAVLEKEGFTTLLGNSDHSIEREEHLISSFLERQPDAFILTGLTHSQRSIKLLSSSGVPVVETWETDGVPIDMSVGFSNIDAGRSLAEALIAKGYQRFGFVGGRLDIEPRSRQRLQGFASALAAAGVPPATVVEVPAPASSIDGVIGFNQLRTRAPETEVVFFSADGLAIPVLLDCQRRRIKVPEDIAICGFGDYDLATIVDPPLTTVRVEAAKMGTAAAQLILRRLKDGDDAEKHVDVGYRVLVRGST